MAGHSKWSNIKRKKGATDAKRGKLFTKLVKEITTASRLGGGDVDANPRLRAAVTTAKANSMPADNIVRAIKKGTGEIDGPAVEEVVYEGYGAGGVAFVVEAQTDNRNRTTAEIRSGFSKNSGNLGATGSVGWMFKKFGQFVFDGASCTEEDLMHVALDAGAEDIADEDGQWVVLTEPTAFAQVMDAFDSNNLKYVSAELTMIPDNTIEVAGADAERVLRLMERLDDLDDVIKVHANFEIDDAEMERIANL